MSRTILTTTPVYEVFRPILLITRTCGLFPITIQTSGTVIVIAWSWTYYFLSLLFAAILVSAILYGLVKSYQIDDVYDVRLKHFSGMFVTILDDACLIFTFVLAAATTPFTVRHFFGYLDSLNKADRLLKYVQGGKKTCYVVVFSTLALTVGMLGVDMATWGKIFNKHVSVFEYILYTVPFYFTYFVVMVVEVNYWFLVHMINVRLRYLNSGMASRWFQGQGQGQGQNVTVYVVNGAARAPSKCSNYLRQQTKAYQALFEASCFLNSFFGVNILVVIVGCLIHLLVTPYDLFLEIKYQDTMFIFPQICWMLSHVLRLLLVVEPCHVSTQQVKKSAALLHKILFKDLDEGEYLQAEAFVRHILHCPIQFSACDLIVLNRPLLTAIVGGVTTYLVILFQFENQQ